MVASEINYSLLLLSVLQHTLHHIMPEVAKQSESLMFKVVKLLFDGHFCFFGTCQSQKTMDLCPENMSLYQVMLEPMGKAVLVTPAAFEVDISRHQCLQW